MGYQTTSCSMFRRWNLLNFFEQKLEDLRQEEQQLLVLINKGIPEDQENYLTWRYCSWKLNEIRKKIQKLGED